jgi:hypothetical protein
MFYIPTIISSAVADRFKKQQIITLLTNKNIRSIIIQIVKPLIQNFRNAMTGNSFNSIACRS